MIRRGAALGFLLLGACEAPAPAPVHAGLGEAGVVPALSVGGQPLDARALAAEAAFHYPEETRALLRGLLRGEFARREAARLGLRPDAREIDEAVAETVRSIEGALPEGEDFESWARGRYGRNGEEVRAAIGARLAENQLYQLALRADARLHERARGVLLIARTEEEARGWARQLRAGASPRRLAANSLDPGPRGDGSGAPLPVYAPAPFGDALRGASVGDVLGPFQLEGDQSRILFVVEERLAAERERASVTELLAGLRNAPISALEARAWFEEMSRRYTARELLPGLQVPPEAFVPVERL